MSPEITKLAVPTITKIQGHAMNSATVPDTIRPPKPPRIVPLT